MGDFKLPSMDGLKKTEIKVKKAVGVTTQNLKTHWLDYVLLFFICFILGAFDIFILRRSDNFLKGEYWSHAACRMTAYVLAGILGVRLGYPKYKNNCKDLISALEKNHRLLFFKEYDGTLFSDFIGDINKEVKKSAWRSKIRKKLKKLDKKSPNFFPLYYIDRNEDHFARFKPKGKIKVFKNIIYNVYKKRAEKYCFKRENLESLLTEEYIEKNIHVLNVKYPHVYEHDFERIEATELGFKFYKTSSNVSGNAARRIGSALLITVIITLIIGSIAIDLDKQLLQDRIIGIFTIIINAMLDIGLTIWRFLSGFFSCEKIVRQEDLRSVLDQNELLIEYKKTLPAETVKEIEITIEKEAQNEENNS